MDAMKSRHPWIPTNIQAQHTAPYIKCLSVCTLHVGLFMAIYLSIFAYYFL